MKEGTKFTGRRKVFEIRGIDMAIASIAAEVVEVAIELPPTFQIRITGDGFNEFNRMLELCVTTGLGVIGRTGGKRKSGGSAEAGSVQGQGVLPGTCGGKAGNRTIGHLKIGSCQTRHRYVRAVSLEVKREAHAVGAAQNGGRGQTGFGSDIPVAVVIKNVQRRLDPWRSSRPGNRRGISRIADRPRCCHRSNRCCSQYPGLPTPCKQVVIKMRYTTGADGNQVVPSAGSRGGVRSKDGVGLPISVSVGEDSDPIAAVLDDHMVMAA